MADKHEIYLESLKSKKGGWTRKNVESLGVPWPLEKGWKQRLLKKWREDDKRKIRRTEASDFLYKELGNDFFDLADLGFLDDIVSAMEKYKYK